MATTTVILGLRKPAGSDFVNVTTDISDNMQLIDNTFLTTTPSTLGIGSAGSAGSATRVARADHAHAGPGFGTPVSVGSVNQSGTALTVARSDHVHSGSGGKRGVVLDTWWPLESSGSDFAYFYLPETATVLRLSLFGDLGRASGPLPVHNHTIPDDIESTGGASVNHTHTYSGTTGTQSVDHSHNVSSSGGHTHNTNHDHTASAGGHGHNLLTDGTGSPRRVKLEGIASAGTPNDLIQSANGTVTVDANNAVSNSTNHTHTTDGASSGHTHDYAGTSSGISADHTHDMSHSHTSDNIGVGGYTNAYRYPQTVSISLDGINRTSSLGGPFGPSQASWQQFDLNIQPYISTPGWHYVTYSNTQGGGRLRAYIYAEF